MRVEWRIAARRIQRNGTKCRYDAAVTDVQSPQLVVKRRGRYSQCCVEDSRRGVHHWRAGDTRGVDVAAAEHAIRNGGRQMKCTPVQRAGGGVVGVDRVVL